MAERRRILGVLRRTHSERAARYVQPLLYTLPQSARDAYPYIIRGVREGLTRTGIVSALRAGGIPISAGSVSALYRPIQRSLEVAGSLARRRLGARLPLDLLPLATTRIAARYSFQIRVFGTDLDGGTLSRYVTVITDNPDITRGEIEATAIRYAERPGSDFIGDRATITSAVQQNPLVM